MKIYSIILKTKNSNKTKTTEKKEKTINHPLRIVLD